MCTSDCVGCEANRRRLLGAAAVVLAIFLCTFLSSSPVWAGVAVGIAPTYPGIVVVGATNVPVSLSMTNVSTSTEATGTLTLSLIRHTPSCGTDTTPCPAGQEDKDVFLVKGILPLNKASGHTGTACAGMTFTIGPPDATTGEVEFLPDSPPVILSKPSGATPSCQIDFAIDVLKKPTKDFSGDPGLQTVQLGRVTAKASANNVTATGTGAGITTFGAPTSAPALSHVPLAGLGVLLVGSGVWLTRKRGVL